MLPKGPNITPKLTLEICFGFLFAWSRAHPTLGADDGWHQPLAKPGTDLTAPVGMHRSSIPLLGARLDTGVTLLDDPARPAVVRCRHARISGLPEERLDALSARLSVLDPAARESCSHVHAAWAAGGRAPW